MSKFKKDGGKETPAISTASLPDIIFILLFFFMVATVMRETELMVQIAYPKATELQKLEKKSLVNYIYVGSPTTNHEQKYGSAPRIQLNDRIADKVEDIRDFILQERSKVDENLIGSLTTSLRVDKDVTMGIVSDIKQELRKVQALKINYSAVQKLD